MRAHRAGFTLIEVLAALVILGIVLPVAMRGVSL
jgi:prepilin-type N-terminal cleavage/methylation domain-containing protein